MRNGAAAVRKESHCGITPSPVLGNIQLRHRVRTLRFRARGNCFPLLLAAYSHDTIPPDPTAQTSITSRLTHVIPCVYIRPNATVPALTVNGGSSMTITSREVTSYRHHCCCEWYRELDCHRPQRSIDTSRNSSSPIFMKTCQ